MRAGWLLALVITGEAMLLHFFSWSVAGGLWRDELVTLNIATLPTWRDMFGAVMNDSFPGGFHVVVRIWLALGLGQSDPGLRALGLCVGLFLLVSFWATSRMMGKEPPLLLLALVALNPVVIRYGDTLRAYGLGTALIILTTGLLWRFIEKPGWRRGLLASAGAVASVQTLYQNSFFVLAICLAGVAVSLRQHQYWKPVGILSIGLVAALSLTAFVKPILTKHDEWQLLQYGTNFWNCLGRLNAMAGIFLGVWLVVAIMAVILSLSRIFLNKLPAEDARQPDLAFFGGIAIVLGVVCFAVFIKSSGLPTQVWYYVPVLAFTMLGCDCVFPRVHAGTRIGMLAIVVFALGLSPSVYSELRWRQSNGDLIAAQVSKAAVAGDLIIVNTWYYGVTFAHYYHGTAEWTTLPATGSYRFQRYDLIMEKMQTPHAIAPVLEQARAALQSGHRVWIVGSLAAPPLGAPMPADPPIAPHGPSGWLDAPYYAIWEYQLGWYIQNHAANVTFYVPEATNAIAVNVFENMGLVAFRGWTTNAPAAVQ